jgi:FtsZ-binding cell division protein ZapB
MVFNVVANYGDKITESVTNIWNNGIKSVLGGYLNQAGGIIPANISDRNASTVGECVKQASHFAMPVARLLAGKVLGFGKSAWSLAVAHPVIATAFALTFIIVPTFKEYCAANKRLTLKALPAMMWMIITRPFRLVYRILMVITGRAEVDKQKLAQSLTRAKEAFDPSEEINRMQQDKAQLQQENTQLRRENEELQEDRKGLLQIVAPLKYLRPWFGTELEQKRRAVITEVSNIVDTSLKEKLLVDIQKIFRDAAAIIANKRDVRDLLIQFTRLKRSCEAHRGAKNVKASLLDWKRCLDLCIATL